MTIPAGRHGHGAALVVLAAVYLISAVRASPQGGLPDRSPQQPVAVRLSADDHARLGDIEVIREIDYGAFVWLEIGHAAFEQLRATGLHFERRRTSLRLQGQTIDTRTPVQAAFSIPGVDGKSLHLIQLPGPAKDEWLAAIDATGTEILQYINPHVYLVRARPAEILTLQALDFTRWSSPYLPEHKVSPELVGRAGLIENVSMTIYDDGRVPGTVEATVGTVTAWGGGLVEQEPSRSSDPFVTVQFVLPASAVHAVATLGSVISLNHRDPVVRYEDEMSNQIIAGNFDPLVPGYAAWQSTAGVTGNGVTVALIDSGYDTGNALDVHPDLSGRTIMLGTPIDLTGHGTHVGGIIAGNGSLGAVDANGFLMGLGVAPQATLVVRFATGPDSERSKDAVVNRAVASNNSYALHVPGIGYNDRDRTYDLLVRDADQTTGGVAEPLIVVFSAGNSGSAGLTKEVKNAIVVGNTLNQRDGLGNPQGLTDIDRSSGSSSRGPAGDGRVMPTLCAPGTNIISTRSFPMADPPLFSCFNLPVGAPPFSPTYSICSGTSMSASHVTGAVALIAQWWRSFNGGVDPSPAMTKALLVNGAVDMGTADIPNGNEGWGRINLSNVINASVPSLYDDQNTLFTSSGQTFTKTFSAADLARPVKVTLAWTDAPGPSSGGNPIALVNDIDLLVNDSGTAYRGNVFAHGSSTSGGAADMIDNLENVFIRVPGSGNFFTVTVTAAGINGDGVPYNGDGADQDFALVSFNAVANGSPPLALCHDVTVAADANCSADAFIDSGSFDPDGDPITLEQTPTGPYPLGHTPVTLTVTDDQGASASCQAIVTVIDATPPTVECSVDESLLWPPNHELITIGLNARIEDACDPSPTVEVVVFSDESEEGRTGDGNHTPDAEAIALNSLQLRSERRQRDDGRVYAILVKATDAAGNVGYDCCTVVVPRSMKKADIVDVLAQATAAEAACTTDGPAGFLVVGVGEIDPLGPHQEAGSGGNRAGTEESEPGRQKARRAASGLRN